MVIMPDNWPLGTRHVSVVGVLLVWMAEAEGDRAERQTYKPRGGGRKKKEEREREGRKSSTEGENEDCLNDREKWM